MAKNNAAACSTSENFPFLASSHYPGKSSFAEAFRTLRTNIHFSFMEKNFCSILITSAGEKEGKTSTAANLAYTMARAGKSVLMIDADLRKPVLSKIVSAKSMGLTGVLSGLFSAEIMSGALDQYGVSDLFRLLALQHKTGMLRLNGENEKVELFFLQGKLRDLNWITRPKKKKLASQLIEGGFLNKEQIRQALINQKDTGQKLGFILINMGIIKKDDLQGILTIQMIEGLRTALLIKKGDFNFQNQPESDFEKASFDPVNFQEIYSQIIMGKEELPFLRKEIQSAIVETGEDNLFLLPSGILPPSPSELLGSSRMSFLISVLKKRYDRLIIDSPPILPASDAILLTPLADGTIFVVKAGGLNREMEKKALEQLQLAQANVIGVALNQVDIKKEGYYKYYSKYYG